MRRPGDHHNEPIPPPSGDPFLDHHRAEQRARQGRVTKLIFVLFLLTLFIVFIIQNSDRHRIDYVFFHRETRLIWIMLTCAVIGGIIGYLVGRPGKQISLRKEKPKRAEHDKGSDKKD